MAALASSSTYAQKPTPAAGGADPSAKAAKSDKAPALSLPEMVTEAGTLEGQIKADARHVLHLQEKARQAKDVIKLGCINDKLVQLKAQVNIFDTVHASLRAGLDAGSTAEDKQSTYAEVTATAGSIKSLRVEADVCVGEPELFKQESSSEVKRPDIVDDPGASNPFTGVRFEAPAYASPFN
ncbi:MAG TPA: hypothetical protein VNO30_09925 [Kofleriaceae bacterium]|nr:hypothetical protein [Kofleriaceae bacterium]